MDIYSTMADEKILDQMVLMITVNGSIQHELDFKIHQLCIFICPLLKNIKRYYDNIRNI